MLLYIFLLALFSVFSSLSLSLVIILSVCLVFEDNNPNPPVFKPLPFFLPTWISKPFSCSFQPRTPRRENPTISCLLSFWHDEACSLPALLNSFKRTDSGSTRLTHTISLTRTALWNVGGSFTVGVAKWKLENNHLTQSCERSSN